MRRIRRKKYNLDKIIEWLKWIGLVLVILYGKGDYDKTKNNADILKTVLEIALLKAETAPACAPPIQETVIYKETADGVRVPIIDNLEGSDTEVTDTPAPSEPDNTNAGQTDVKYQCDGDKCTIVNNNPNIPELPVKPVKPEEPKKTEPERSTVNVLPSRWALLFPAPFYCQPCESAKRFFVSLASSGHNAKIITDDGGAIYQAWITLIGGPLTTYPVIILGEQYPKEIFQIDDRYVGFDTAIAQRISDYLSTERR